LNETLKRVSMLLLFMGLTSALAADVSRDALLLVVRPEAYLDPGSVQFAVQISPDSPRTITKTVLVRAWVRALPEQHISVLASAPNFGAPAGQTGVPVISWNNSPVRATGGGAEASCIGGSFADSQEQPLIANWNRSGIVECSLTFSIAVPASWQPGLYTGSVDLRLKVQ
jgi:hypothetical protein